VFPKEVNEAEQLDAARFSGASGLDFRTSGTHVNEPQLDPLRATHVLVKKHLEAKRMDRSANPLPRRWHAAIPAMNQRHDVASESR
jgi:hypothetical protein